MPYSTYHVVAVPFGLTLPETVAVVGPTEVTGPVEALGADAAAAGAAPAMTAVAATTAANGLNISRRVLPAPVASVAFGGAVLRTFYTDGAPPP